MALSEIETKILRALQEDATVSHEKLAEEIGTSRSNCWRKIRELTEAGFIRRQAALLDRKKLGLEIVAYVEVSMVEHVERTRSEFEAYVMDIPEILSCYSVSGDRDYILLVASRNMEAYDRFLNKFILNHKSVRSAKSTFTLREVKQTTALPLIA